MVVADKTAGICHLGIGTDCDAAAIVCLVAFHVGAESEFNRTFDTDAAAGIAWGFAALAIVVEATAGECRRVVFGIGSGRNRPFFICV